MKKWMILLALLLCFSCAAAEELPERYVIYNVYADEDYSAYSAAASQYGYKISEWSGSDGNTIRVEAPQKACGDFAYALLPDGTAAITKVLAERKIIDIPSEIDGHTVTQIGCRASSGLRWAAHVAASHPMEKLVIPDTVTYIGTYSFFRVNDLKEIILPDTLEYLGDECIVDSAAQNGTLPANLKYFGQQMGHALGLSGKKLELPKGLEGIGSWAFCWGNWQQVVLPASLQFCGEEVFSGCRKLTAVTMEEGLTGLGKGMFKECTALAKITIPASLEWIDEFAFDGCKKLASVKFTDGAQLERIAQGAFSNCTALKSIALPDGLGEIAGEAFYGCKALSSVTIPASVTSIGDYAFEGCSAKLVLTVEEGSFADIWAQENGVKVKYPKKK